MFGQLPFPLILCFEGMKLMVWEAELRRRVKKTLLILRRNLYLQFGLRRHRSRHPIGYTKPLDQSSGALWNSITYQLDARLIHRLSVGSGALSIANFFPHHSFTLASAVLL